MSRVRNCENGGIVITFFAVINLLNLYMASVAIKTATLNSKFIIYKPKPSG